MFAWETKVQEVTTTGNTLKVVLEPNEQQKLSIDENLSKNSNVNWSSSDSTVANVDSNGLVTALSKSNTKLSVTYSNGLIEFINILAIEDASDYRLAINLKKGQ